MKSSKKPTPTSSFANNISRDWDCWEKHEQYMTKKGFKACIPEWWAMYEGRQTPPDFDEDLPRATENICSWVVDSQHATMLGTTVSLNFTCFDEDISTDALKKFDEYQQKSMKMDAYKDKVVLDALVSSAGLLYHYWSDNQTAMKANKKGSLCLDAIAIEDFMCSNPRLDNIQKQKYVGWRKREEVKAIRATVDKNIKDYDKIIAAIVPDDYTEEKYADEESIEAGLATVITRMFRVDGEVYWTRSTKHVQLCEPIPLNPKLTSKKLKLKDANEINGYSPDSDEIYELDPEVDSFQDESLESENDENYAKEKDKMSLYPIALLTLKPRRNCIYGRSEIEEVSDNQKIINFMISMTAKEIQDTAWATVIMKEGAANGQTWTGKPGGMFIDYTPGPNFGIKRLEGNQLNSQVMNYVSSLIDITKMLTGTNELVSASSNLKDVTAYALQILEEQRNKKIEILQNRYWRFLIDCAEIRLEFYKHYYPETYYLYELTDAEFSEEKQSYSEMLANPDEEITLPDGSKMTQGEVASKKGEPTKVQRKVMKPEEELLGHSFDIVCEAGKGSKYSEIIDMDLINNLFLNGGYEKMSADSFEMWLNLNSFMSESKKSDIKVLLNKQKASELAQVKGQNAQLQQMLRTALARVKMMETALNQQNDYIRASDKEFKDRMNAANEIVGIKEKEMQQMRKEQGGAGSKLPSAEEMANSD